MFDLSSLKGVVSAYNAVTKETIFSNVHNVVTVREKVWALSKIAGFAAADYTDSNIFLDTPSGTTVNQIKNLGSISKFKVGSRSDSSFPVENVDIAGWDDTPSHLYDVDYFNNSDSYAVSDIGDDQKTKKIIYLKDSGAFLRLKLSLFGGSSTGRNGLDIQPGFSKDINLIGLCDSNSNLLTQFRFPAITFYADTQVDFEYRLYL